MFFAPHGALSAQRSDLPSDTRASSSFASVPPCAAYRVFASVDRAASWRRRCPWATPRQNKTLLARWWTMAHGDERQAQGSGAREGPAGRRQGSRGSARAARERAAAPRPADRASAQDQRPLRSPVGGAPRGARSEEHTSELQSL